MSELKTLQCKAIEERLIIALNEALDTLECIMLNVKEGNISYCVAKKMANKYIPIMLRNSNRLREFRLFMKNNEIKTSNVDFYTRLDKYVHFFC